MAVWSSVGPVNFSGRIRSLAVHPTQSGIVYAGAANGGVWAGTGPWFNDWKPLMQSQPSMAIGALALAPSDPARIYAATGEDVPDSVRADVYLSPSFAGVGVYVSANGGIDWDLSPIASDRCTRVLVHPQDPLTVYVAGNRGLHKSTNGGASWRRPGLEGHVSDALLDPNAPNTLYVGVWNVGVKKSTDGGKSWTRLARGLPTGMSAGWIKLAGAFKPKKRAFLVAKMGPTTDDVYISEDSGESWQKVAGYAPENVWYFTWTSMVAVDPDNPLVIFAGGVNLQRSQDGGKNFAQFAGQSAQIAGTIHADHHALVFDPFDSSRCYLATDGGIYVSSDTGQNWSLPDIFLTATQLYSIGVSRQAGKGRPFVKGSATQDQGILISYQPLGNIWIDAKAGPEGGFFVVDPSDSNNLYSDYYGYRLQRSTDGGATWATIGTPALLASGALADLGVNPNDPSELLCCSGKQLFRSTNQGDDWTPVLDATASLTRVVFGPTLIQQNMAVQYSYTATRDGRVYRSADRVNWAEPYSDQNRPNKNSTVISALAVDWIEPRSVYIGFAYSGYGNDHVYRSSDGGQTWIAASGGGNAQFPDVPINELVVDQYHNDTLYAATDIGMFSTQDWGASWQPFSQGMPRILTTGLALHLPTNVLYASTLGRGAYARQL